MKSLRLSSAALALLCAVTLTISDPAPQQFIPLKTNRRDGFPNILSIFGWGRKPEAQQQDPAISMGPCYQTTTTTTPASAGKLCPLISSSISLPQQILPSGSKPGVLDTVANQVVPAISQASALIQNTAALTQGQGFKPGQGYLPGIVNPSGQALQSNLGIPYGQLPAGQFVQIQGYPPGPQGLGFLIFPGQLIPEDNSNGDLIAGDTNPLQQLPAQPSLPDLPAVPAQPSLPNVPTPTPPSLPQAPAQPSLPNLPAAPAQPSLPDLPAVPAQPTPPSVPAQPSLPDLPTVPAQPTPPSVPAQPSLPDVPAVPSQPSLPNVPAVPAQPSIPNVPAVPAQPSLPNVPAVPAQPSLPNVPAAPAQPSLPALPSSPQVPQTPNVPVIPGIGATGFIFDTPDGLPPPGWVFPAVNGDGTLTASSSNIQIVPAPYPMDSLQTTCAGLPAGPYIPPGYYLVDNQLQQQQCMDKCGLSAVTTVPCSMIQVFDQLRLRTIYNLTVEAGLELLFLQTTNYTFFAPVDPAFDRLPAWFMQALRSDRKLLIQFVMNHFIKIEIPLESLGNEFLVSNARGSPLRINVYNQDTDYRIYTVDGSKVLVGGIHTTTGILHLVDKVLMPVPFRNVAEYLAEVPEFSSFLKAVIDSGLLPYFQEDYPITVFIPQNLAFKNIDYAKISADPNALRNLVLFHVVNGTYFSSGLVHGQYLTTNYYKEIRLSVQTDGFTRFADSINGGIRIIKPDIALRDGVAHVIDSCITLDPNFYINEEMSEFGSEYGTFRRSMVLNKQEVERESSSAHSKSFAKKSTN